MILELTIAGLPSCNSAAAPSWRTRHAERRKWHAAVAAAVLMELGRWPTPLAHARVTITRCSAGPEPDGDNLASGAKFLLDGLVKCRVIADDRPSCIGTPTFAWERVPRGSGCVRLRVESVDVKAAIESDSDGVGHPAASGVEIGERVQAMDLTGGIGA